MNKKIIIISIIVILVLPTLFITGCQKVSEITTDTFLATYSFPENGRSISISGNSKGKSGEQSEYTITFNNNVERWQDEYRVLIVDSESVIHEISHESIDIGPMTTVLKPVTVEFPSDIQGVLGLWVMTEENPATLIAYLSIAQGGLTLVPTTSIN
jgi:hypothetical protein